jgi:nitroreductase
MSATTVAEVIRSRHSIRRYLDKPVPQELLAEVLELASWAPSGNNVQPWKVYALAGADLAELKEGLLASARAGAVEVLEYPYYPQEWFEPYLARRRKVGFGLYEAAGIARDDKAGRIQQNERNFLFFDAPVGLIITLDKRFEVGMLLDVGVFIGNLVLAAEAAGLATCVQQIFAGYPQTVHRIIGAEDEIIACGISLGYADPAAPVNNLTTERAPVSEFAEFRGF